MSTQRSLSVVVVSRKQKEGALVLALALARKATFSSSSSSLDYHSVNIDIHYTDSISREHQQNCIMSHVLPDGNVDAHH